MQGLEAREQGMTQLPRRVYVMTNDGMRDHASMSDQSELFSRWRLLHTIRPLAIDAMPDDSFDRIYRATAAVTEAQLPGFSCSLARIEDAIPMRFPPLVPWHGHAMNRSSTESSGSDVGSGQALEQVLVLPTDDVSAGIETSMQVGPRSSAKRLGQEDWAVSVATIRAEAGSRAIVESLGSNKLPPGTKPLPCVVEIPRPMEWCAVLKHAQQSGVVRPDGE